MVSGVCSALDTLIHLLQVKFWVPTKEKAGGKYLTEESFLLELCKSGPCAGPRVIKASLRPWERGYRSEIDARAQDPFEADSAQTEDGPWRTETGIYSSRHLQKQAQNIAKQRDSSNVCWLEIINCSPFCTCLGASLVLPLEFPDTFLSGP